MCLALRFGFGIGVVPINAFQVCLKLLPNFYGKSSAAFRLIFVSKIQQRFASNASLHAKRYSHQDFECENTATGMPHFHDENLVEFRVWCVMAHGRVLRLCIRCISTCLHCDELKPPYLLSVLMLVTYIRKPTSLGDMDRNNHTALIMHTIQHEYASTTIAP